MNKDCDCGFKQQKNKTFRVTGTLEVNFEKIIEAESEQEIEKMFENNEVGVNADEIVSEVDFPQLEEIVEEK